MLNNRNYSQNFKLSKYTFTWCGWLYRLSARGRQSWKIFQIVFGAIWTFSSYSRPF